MFKYLFKIKLFVKKLDLMKIHKLYLNLFGRKADYEGLNYWIELINSKNYTISDIVYNLLYSKDKYK